MTKPIADKPLYTEPGRTRVSMEALRQVVGFNQHRVTLLDEFETFLSLVRGVIPICAVWVSGSCLTEKEAPKDVDAVLVLSAERVDALTGLGPRRLVTAAGLHQLAHNRNLHVDAYALIWRPRPEATTTAEDDELLSSRGYWDDFWLRLRTVPKGQPPTRACAVPRRGYVEVVLDDYV